MKKQNIKMISILLLLMAGIAGCGAQSDTNQEEQQSQEDYTTSLNETGRYVQEGNLPISDNTSLYKLDDDLEVVTMYLTVQEGNELEGTDHTWKEINDNSVYYYDELGTERYQVEGILQIGNEDGPIIGEFGYEALSPNVTVTIRGQTSSYRAQKNYKISIKDGKGSYKNQTTINLNKHVGEGLRYRNKLCYDLMEELPGMMSARTQFVHLYVRDKTASGNGEYEDYGLYTQVEQINKTYLKNHGLDKNGQLYKINFFEFNRYEDVIMLSGNADYDVEAFEDYLEIKGNDEHSKLIAMLEDVNDLTKPIEEVFTKWFDEENVFSWLAFHILVGNKDTQSRNFFLYSPLNVDKWYFISWDNDAAFMDTERELQGWRDGLEWQTGVSNYWGNTLFRRILKSPEYREKLHEKILAYRDIITEEKLTQMSQNYETIVEKYIWSLPDVTYLPVTYEQRQQILTEFPKEVERNYQLYLESLKKPQPFFIGTPELTVDGLSLVWDVSYDFAGEDITYTVELDDDYTFTDVLYREEDVYYPKLEIPRRLNPGKYYVRIKAKNESGLEQYAFDTYYEEKNGNHYGIKCFYITEDGTVVEESYEE